MKPEAHDKFLKEEQEYDKLFKEQLLADIPYFHRLHVKYQDTKWLEIAKDLGKALKSLSTPR
jgi:hypothetical protein